MGAFRDHLIAQYENHTIELEGRSDFADGKNKYYLIIDNQRVDEASVMYGKFTLRGRIDEPNGEKINVTVWCKQGVFGLKSNLEINGRSYNFSKLK